MRRRSMSKSLARHAIRRNRQKSAILILSSADGTPLGLGGGGTARVLDDLPFLPVDSISLDLASLLLPRTSIAVPVCQAAYWYYHIPFNL